MGTLYRSTNFCQEISELLFDYFEVFIVEFVYPTGLGFRKACGDY
jgi:hypothetical protein